jgi:hypothetical protein
VGRGLLALRNATRLHCQGNEIPQHRILRKFIITSSFSDVIDSLDRRVDFMRHPNENLPETYRKINNINLVRLKLAKKKRDNYTNLKMQSPCVNRRS